jgi:hypothetical protein
MTVESFVISIECRTGRVAGNALWAIQFGVAVEINEPGPAGKLTQRRKDAENGANWKTDLPL